MASAPPPFYPHVLARRGQRVQHGGGITPHRFKQEVGCERADSCNQGGAGRRPGHQGVALYQSVSIQSSFSFAR